MGLHVTCVPGFRGAAEPQEFQLGARRMRVRAIVDRWFAPGQCWFKIDADDGDVYILHHDEASAAWRLVAYTSAVRAAVRELAPEPGQAGAAYLRPPRSSM